MATPALLQRVGASAGTIAQAITHPPYGWGEHRDFTAHAEHATVQVVDAGQLVDVEYYHFLIDSVAPTVFVFNGFTANASVYGPLGQAIWQRGYNVVLISLPGHGQTGLPTDHALSYADTARLMVSAMEQIVDRYELRGPICLLGHSHGGGVAEAISAQLGDSIDRLILLAAVGGSAWSLLVDRMRQGLEAMRTCQMSPTRAVADLQIPAMLLGEGFLLIPPPWQLAGWLRELALPFVSGFAGERRIIELWSVAIDTILGDAESLEDDLAQIARSGTPTACLAGGLDGVINRRVIGTQARACQAGVFRYTSTHASFLAPEARRRIAEFVTLSDDDFQHAVANHRLLANV